MLTEGEKRPQKSFSSEMSELVLFKNEQRRHLVSLAKSGS